MLKRRWYIFFAVFLVSGVLLGIVTISSTGVEGNGPIPIAEPTGGIGIVGILSCIGTLIGGIGTLIGAIAGLISVLKKKSA